MGNLDFSANADQLKELAAYMASQINVPTIGIGGGYAPIGTIIPLMGTTAPQDYLACDGTIYNIADYPQLADYFESQFGESNHFGGDGATTFAVPDLQGEFLRGTGTNSHTNQGSGANVGEHQDGTEHLNVWNYSNNGIFFGVTGTNNEVPSGLTTKRSVDSVIASGVGYAGSSVGNKVSASNINTSFTSRPTNTSVLYCIKAVVAGEVYSTEERVVGTWIDGKKIYQKTIYCGVLPNNTSKKVAHGISNLKRVIHSGGYSYISANNAMLNLPHISSTSASDYITLYVSGANIVISTGKDRSNITESYVTLRYIKTTD